MRKPGVNTYVYCSICNKMTQPYLTVHWCQIEREGVVIRLMKKTWDSSIGTWVLSEDDPDTMLEKRRERDRSRERSWKGYKKSFVKKEDDVRDSNRYYDAASNTWRDLEGKAVDLEGKAVEEDGDEKRTSITWNEYLRRKYGDKAEEVKGNLETGYSTCEIPKREEKKEDKEKKEKPPRPEEIQYHLDSCHCPKCYDYQVLCGEKPWWKPVEYIQAVPCKPWEGLDAKRWPNTFHFCFRFYFANYNWYNSGKYIPDAEYRDRILFKKYKPEKPSVKVDHSHYYGPYSPYGDWEGEGYDGA